MSQYQHYNQPAHTASSQVYNDGQYDENVQYEGADGYIEETDQGYNEAEPTDTSVVPCHPSHLQSSLNYFGASYDLMNKTRLQFGVICQPLADVGAYIPVVNFGDIGVLRCRVCRAYINCFCGWFNGGAQWKCSVCQVSNDCPKRYFAQTDTSGTRYDILERDELRYGSYDIQAPDEYTVRPPQPPSFYFLINVNKRCNETNVVTTVCDTILRTLDVLPGGDRAMIGILTYHTHLHFYSFSNDCETATMHTIPDFDDPIMPLPSSQLLVNVKQHRTAIETLLQTIPTMHAATKSAENAVGSALTAALEVMRDNGGKIIAFSYGLPSLGKGQLMNRTKDTKFSDAKEFPKIYHLLLKRANNYFVDLAIEMTKLQTNADLFQFSDGDYCDVASLKAVTRCCGGELRYYHRFEESMHSEALSADITRTLTRLTGWEAVMRVRASRGVSIKQYYGAFHRRNTDLLIVPTIDSDKAITLLLAHSDNTPITTGDICVQSALLYTSSEGERRIRVNTINIPVSSSLFELYDGVNLSVMSALIAKQACLKMFSKDVATARMYVQDSCVGPLHRLVRNVGHRSLQNEDCYPESVRFWPLNTLGLLKCSAFADVNDVLNWVSIDSRTALLTAIISMAVLNIDLLVRPSLMDIHTLFYDTQIGQWTADNTVIMPSESPLTKQSLTTEGIYLLDDGQNFTMRVGRRVDPNQLSELFGIHHIKAHNKPLQLNEYIEEASEESTLNRVWNIIYYLRQSNIRFQPLRIILEGSPPTADKAFHTLFMVRDKTDSVMNYDEFLDFILKISLRPLEGEKAEK